VTSIKPSWLIRFAASSADRDCDPRKTVTPPETL
jgi:hypothetical protein